MESLDPTPTLEDGLDLTATLTSLLSTATSTIIDSILNNNSTDSDSPFLPGTPPIGEDAETHNEGNPFLNFVVGFIIVLAASIMNAFGLNLTKLDHTRNAGLPMKSRRKDWMRPMWVGGMAMYIASQIFGSTLSLQYLRSEWVAPLGSTSLIFNFLFAKWLVGTPVTKEDVRGTALIVGSVVLILVFSSINHGLDGSISLHRLATLWKRPNWLAWFFFVSFSTIIVYTSTSLLSTLLKIRASLSPIIAPFDPSLAPTSGGGRRRASASNPVVRFIKAAESRRKYVDGRLLARLERLLERTDDKKIRFLEGIGWAVVGGSLAGGCLVFTKAVVKLLGEKGHPFTHPTALITLLLVALTAILQIICLNRALKAADSTLVVPLFYAGYTIFGFVNTLIFLNETEQYETWVLVAIFLSIGVLVAGVVLLSLKDTEALEREAGRGGGETVTVNASDPTMRMNPVQRQMIGVSSESAKETASASDCSTLTAGGSSVPARDGGEVYELDGVYGLGDVSDDDDDEDHHHDYAHDQHQHLPNQYPEPVVETDKAEDEPYSGDTRANTDTGPSTNFSEREVITATTTRGVGGVKGRYQGERGGLLFDEEEEEEAMDERDPWRDTDGGNGSSRRSGSAQGKGKGSDESDVQVNPQEDGGDGGDPFGAFEEAPHR